MSRYQYLLALSRTSITALDDLVKGPQCVVQTITQRGSIVYDKRQRPYVKSKSVKWISPSYAELTLEAYHEDHRQGVVRLK
jgi:hypothetical protein